MALTAQPATDLPQKGKKKAVKVEEQAQEQHQDRNDKARCMGFLLSIIKIFMNGALLSTDHDKLFQLIMHSSTNPMQKVSKKESDSEQKSSTQVAAATEENDAASNSSNLTANFGQTSDPEP